MAKRICGLVLTVCFVAAAFAPARAQLYTVRDVPLDATADSATAARQSALAGGQRRALDRLLRRLTLEIDHGRVPVVSAADAVDYVQSYELSNEKRSARRYIADMTVRFRPEPVRRLLRANNIPYAETVSAPLLVLPITFEGAVARLWDEDSPWWAAWRALSEDAGLVPVIVPLGELADISAVDAEQALSGDRRRLAGIAARYGARETLVAVVRLPSSEAPESDDALIVEFEARRFGGGAQADAELGTRFSDRLAGFENESLDQILTRGAGAIVARIESTWKAANVIAYGDQREIMVTVPITSLADWIQLRARLDATARVENTEIEALSTGRARLRIRFVGSEADLAEALARRRVDLVDTGLEWTLVDLNAEGRAPIPTLSRQPGSGAVRDPGLPPANAPNSGGVEAPLDRQRTPPARPNPATSGAPDDFLVE